MAKPERDWYDHAPAFSSTPCAVPFPIRNAPSRELELAAVTTTGVVEHWLALHKEQKLWSWGTQPPLMAAFYRNFHMLDSSWNVRHFGIPPLRSFFAVVLFLLSRSYC